jgi:hypothetical protein
MVRPGRVQAIRAGKPARQLLRLVDQNREVLGTYPASLSLVVELEEGGIIARLVAV